MFRAHKVPLMSLGALCTVIILASGCAQTQRTEFYTLESIDQTQNASAAKSAVSGIIVGPVILPQYLDRPQFIRRPDRYTMDLADFAHWAEPLHDMISRVVVENLSAMLVTDQIYFESSLLRSRAAYQVDLTIFRFDINEDNEAVLTVRWNIMERRRDKILVTQKTSYVVQADAQTYEADASAMSRCLAQLSEDIATEFRQLKSS